MLVRLLFILAQRTLPFHHRTAPAYSQVTDSACDPLTPGVDLFYQDRMSAPGHPFLFGAALPWDFGEVFTPGAAG
jgi:hypothetical protein